MPKVRDIENAWVAFVRAAIEKDFPDHTVILAEQDGSRPDKPYLTLKITGPFKVMENDPRKWEPKTGTFKFATHRRYNISIQSYGIEHLDVLDDILLESQNPISRAKLKECDIGIELRGNVTDVSNTVSTAWEKRGSLDISFLASKIKNTNIGPIETAEIGEGEFIKENDTIKTVDKFTVSEP